MTALNFSVFIDKVENGTKPHTIRKHRKNSINVGDPLQLYTGMRTKKCRRLGVHGNHNQVCTRIDEIIISKINEAYLKPITFSIRLNGFFISIPKILELVRNDGFYQENSKAACNAHEFSMFFLKETNVFKGNLIWWGNPDGYAY